MFFGALAGGFAFKVIMPKQKPEETLENPNSARPLGIVLGATEFIFLLGLILLATGCGLVFGVEMAVLVVGSVLVVTAWLMQFAK